MASVQRGGFTLVEMLVVIGIIGILTAALLSSFSRVKHAAYKAQAQALVKEAATAFTRYLEDKRVWHTELLGKQEMDEEVCRIFQVHKYLDVMPYEISSGGTVLKTKSKISLDRFGLLDPWARNALKKRNVSSASAAFGSSGRSFKDHRLQYRLDRDLDGFVDGSEGSPQAVKVRASVLVWARGPDGLDDFNQSGRYPKDDVLSWPHASYAGSK